MSRENAETTLDPCPQGTYLVRISNKQLSGQQGAPGYAISLKAGGTVKHMRVCSSVGEAPGVANQGEFLYLCKKKLFRSIVDLVTWYQEHTLAESFAGLDETLRTPYKAVSGGPTVISYALVVHDFEPSHTASSDQGKAQFLPLAKGTLLSLICLLQIPRTCTREDSICDSTHRKDFNSTDETRSRFR